MDIKITKLKYETSDKIVTQAEWKATVFEGEQVEDALDEEGNIICPGPFLTKYIESTEGVATFYFEILDENFNVVYRKSSADINITDSGVTSAPQITSSGTGGGSS